MPKKKTNGAKKRITRQEAEKLYPNEWVLFTEPNGDQETTTFINGSWCGMGRTRRNVPAPRKAKGAASELLYGPDTLQAGNV